MSDSSPLLASSALAWNALRGRLSQYFTSITIPLLAAYMLFSIAYLPAMEPSRPVKEICMTIRDLAQPAGEAGYFRAAAPSLVYYLRRPIFEAYEADSMVKRCQSGKRVFCVLSEEDYDYFVGTRDFILYVLDRHPRPVIKLSVLLNDNDAAEQELLLVSNKPSLETGALEGRDSR